MTHSGPSAEQTSHRASRRTDLLRVVAAVLLGIAIGVGGYAFHYGEGTAYLSHDPTACTNCHVMQGQFDSWEQSSHRHVAVCNDCHLPHGFASKWVTKLDNGFMHSVAFTTGDFPDPIRIKSRNSRRAQSACLHCHADFVHPLLPVESGGDMVTCFHCHEDVGHAQR